jgi:hypothetical protein
MIKRTYLHAVEDAGRFPSVAWSEKCGKQDQIESRDHLQNITELQRAYKEGKI